MSSFIEDEEQPDDLVRYTCDICNRRFSDAALSKHRVICLKNAQRKRKVFDSRLQRARGLQMPKTKTDSAAILRERELKLAQIQERKSNWRMKHEEFISAIRAAKEYTFAKRSGGPLPPPPPSTIDPDLIQCKFCLRRFNEKAAERHIRFCEEKHKQMPKNPSKRSRNPTYSHAPPPIAPQKRGICRINGTVDKYRTKEVCGRSDGKVNKFCLECGSPFPNATAKFCPECGLRRMAV